MNYLRSNYRNKVVLLFILITYPTSSVLACNELIVNFPLKMLLRILPAAGGAEVFKKLGKKVVLNKLDKKFVLDGIQVEFKGERDLDGANTVYGLIRRYAGSESTFIKVYSKSHSSIAGARTLRSTIIAGKMLKYAQKVVSFGIIKGPKRGEENVFIEFELLFGGEKFYDWKYQANKMRDVFTERTVREMAEGLLEIMEKRIQPGELDFAVSKSGKFKFFDTDEWGITRNRQTNLPDFNEIFQEMPNMGNRVRLRLKKLVLESKALSKGLKKKAIEELSTPLHFYRKVPR